MTKRRLKILCAVDDVNVAHAMRSWFIDACHDVKIVSSAKDAYRLGVNEIFDVFVLNGRLPDGAGLEVRHRLREYGRLSPVVLIVDDHEIDHRVREIRGTIGDYLCKPFSAMDLMLCVEGLSARHQQFHPVLEIGGLTLNVEQRRLSARGAWLSLKPDEARILEFLMRYPGVVLSPETIFREAIGPRSVDGSRLVRRSMHQLHRNIRALGVTASIEWHFDKGFRLRG